MTKPARALSGQLEIIRRLIQPKNGDLRPTLARYLLTLHFSEEDKARMHELAVKNQQGGMEQQDKEELDHYIEAGHLLTWLHAKARLSLKKRDARIAHG